MKKFKVFVALFIGLLFCATAFAQTVVPLSPVVAGEIQKALQQSPQPPNQNVQRPAEQAKTEDEKELLKKFEEELAKYGKWVDNEEYGKVWVPNDAKKEDWKPYQDGKWQEHDGECNYWWSYEPYGYITYHYGWWQWSPIWSWYWIPGYAWGPAWVNWWWYGSYICWSPMWYDYGYYNRYYGRLYSHSNGIGWNVIRRDQLRSPNLSRTIRTTQTSNMRIASNQIQSNLRNASVLRSNSRTYPSRNVSQVQRTNSSPVRNSLSRPSLSSRFSGLTRSSVSPVRNYSAPSRSTVSPRTSAPIRSFSAPRSVSSSRGGGIRRR